MFGMNRAFLLTLLFVACGPEQVPAAAADPAVDQQSQVGSTTTPLTGFPCDVREVLQTNCAGCHAGSAYYLRPFTSRADFFQPVGTGLLGVEVALRVRPGAEAPMPPVYSEK